MRFLQLSHYECITSNCSGLSGSSLGCFRQKRNPHSKYGRQEEREVWKNIQLTTRTTLGQFNALNSPSWSCLGGFVALLVGWGFFSPLKIYRKDWYFIKIYYETQELARCMHVYTNEQIRYSITSSSFFVWSQLFFILCHCVHVLLFTFNFFALCTSIKVFPFLLPDTTK